MVGGWVLHDLYRAISHITNTNDSGCWLRADEFPQILQLRIQAVICSIIDQQKKFEPGMLSLQWEPVGYLIAVVTLIHHYIFTIDKRYVGAVTSFHCNHYVHWNSRRRGLLGYKRGIADRQRRHCENYCKSEISFCHRILLTSLPFGMSSP